MKKTYELSFEELLEHQYLLNEAYGVFRQFKNKAYLVFVIIFIVLKMALAFPLIHSFLFSTAGLIIHLLVHKPILRKRIEKNTLTSVGEKKNIE